MKSLSQALLPTPVASQSVAAETPVMLQGNTLTSRGREKGRLGEAVSAAFLK